MAFPGSQTEEEHRAETSQSPDLPSPVPSTSGSVICSQLWLGCRMEGLQVQVSGLSETKSNQFKWARSPWLIRKREQYPRYLWKLWFQIVSQDGRWTGSNLVLESKREYQLFDTVFRILKPTSPNTEEPELHPPISSLWLTHTHTHTHQHTCRHTLPNCIYWVRDLANAFVCLTTQAFKLWELSIAFRSIGKTHTYFFF